MVSIMYASTALTVIATLLLIALCSIYAKSYVKTKSSFALGLLLFAGVSLVHYAVTLYYYFTMMDYYVPQVQTQVFILSLLSTIAFAILVKLSWE